MTDKAIAPVSDRLIAAGSNRRVAGDLEEGMGGLEVTTSECLRRAADAVIEAWTDRDESGTHAERDRIVESLCLLIGWIEELRAGGTPEVSDHDGGFQRPSFYFRLLESLRQQLLEGASAAESDASEATEVLGILLVMERIPELLWPSRDGDPIARLTEPDALELVVEMAHDINSPLNSVLFLAETIRSGHSGPVNELQSSQLGLMYSAALRIMTMAGDVMEMAKLRRPLTAEPPAPFSMWDVFEMVREMVRPMAEEKGNRLEFRPSGSGTFVGHSVPLGRVLLNLTTNALKFTEKGTVIVSARWVGPSEIEFSVSDTGRGIHPDKQHLLFEPFQAATGREGHFFSVSGLGLSIARRLVAAMGSELMFETAEGKGTRFYFRLRLPSPED